MCIGASFERPCVATLSRRTLLAGAAAAAGALLLGGRTDPAGGSVVDLDGVAVRPRSEWAGGLGPVGPIPPEPEVRYLLVHHSAEPGNDYGEGEVAGILRGFYRFHTSATKGWPDLAYNFMVDRFGRVWEGRAGSLAGPVAGDATGGNQGFDQLCCFVGNHQQEPPSTEALAAMGRLLGALSTRYGVPVGPDATTVFTSRGSNRHPAGAQVATPTITGHRDMSRTQCPGDAVMARLGDLRSLAAAAGGAPALTRVAPESASPTTAAPSRPTIPATPPPATEPSSPSTTGATAPTSRTTAASSPPPANGPGDNPVPAAAAVGGAALVAAGAATWAHRRRQLRAPVEATSGDPDSPPPAS